MRTAPRLNLNLSWRSFSVSPTNMGELLSENEVAYRETVASQDEGIAECRTATLPNERVTPRLNLVIKYNRDN